MTLRALIGRGLLFHWRSHLGVALGAAVGSAALAGALIVGDSVRGSLRERALERLGATRLAATTGDRFVSSELVDRMRQASMDRNGRPVQIAGALQLLGTASTADGSARANHIRLIGVDSVFWNFAPRGPRPPEPAANEVLLNPALAAQLSARAGDEILVRVPKPSALSRDVVISSRDDAAIGLRLRVAGVVEGGSLGNFALDAGAGPPLNAFVALGTLHSIPDFSRRLNVLLAAGNEPREEPCPRTACLKAGLDDALRRLWTPVDAGFEARWLTNPPVVEVSTARVFLDPPLVRSALAAAANAQPVLTFLANLVTVGTNATPYSMVTAGGAPWTPPDLRDDEIILNQWLADDLQAGPGDALTLVYFDPESGARLTERTNTFRVHSVAPMQMPWADRALMPQFPGVKEAETTAEWDTAFPLVHTIRPQDDDYWTEWRGTPKAFVTLAAGQRMWANRFGSLTAIRFPVPANSGGLPAGGPEPLAGTLREPAAKDGRATDAKAFRAALEKRILATLDPGELGLRFEPVRERALKAAAQSQDFGGLFIGFSLFVIAAALLLMAMLFQFSLEQRAAETGALLALGFTPGRVRRLLMGEGAALALLGGALGTLGGIFYARAMLHGLATIWRDASGGGALAFFVTPRTLVIGLLASTLVAVFTLWLALRKQARLPARVLLAGNLERGDSPLLAVKPPAGQAASKRAREPQDEDCEKENQPLPEKRGNVRAPPAAARRPASWIGWLALSAGIALAGGMLARGEAANAGAFFGAGSLVLIGGLCLLSARWAASLSPSSVLHPPSMASLTLRSLARRRSRSVATVAMLAIGAFLIVSIGVFRLDANRDATKPSSGTGGFALVGESTMPVFADLNTRAGREMFALNEADFDGVNFVQFRVRAGDEASCLNLNRAQQPRLLGVRPEAMEGRFTFVKGEGWRGLRAGAVSRPPPPDSTPKLEAGGASALPEEVPAIGDAASIQWAMGRRVGDILDYVDERGRPFRIRIVGAVANSILQGHLIIDEAGFAERFPGESGFRYFLIDAPTNRVAGVSAALSRALQDAGLELTPAPRRLAQFNAVQNTYLGTFQILGGLGLLLGSAGLGIVVLRNVLERRGELAALIAVGWRRRAVNQLVLREHLALLGLGLATGLAAALVAVLPSLLTPGAEFPWLTLGLTLAAVLANGVVWTWLAARFALRGDLLAALRGE